MKHNRNPLATAIHYALGASALAGLAMTAAPAAAQEEEEAVLERVEVTGTRLSRIDFEGASPVTIVSRADIERIGLNDVGEILRQLPSVTGSPVGTNTNNGNTGGVSLTNLRGMGTVRTLILINGRRTQTNDLSAIPVAALERIEVLKEGASAVYGADAVAGVVNFITRRDFSGAQVTAQFGQSLELDRNPTADELNNEALAGSDGDVGRISLTLGDVGPRGSFILGAERTKQDPVYQGNIDQVQFRQEVVFSVANFLAAGGYPDCLNTTPVACPPTGGSSSSLGGFFNVPPGGPLAPGGGFFTRDLDTGAIRPFDGTTDLYNYAPINFIQQPFTRTSIFGQGEFDLFENVNAYLETRWTNRRSEAELAPTPLFVGIFDPPFTGVDADNAFNPFGVTVPDARRRVAESRRRFTNNVTRIDVTVGLRGDFGAMAPTWSWDTAYSWAHTSWPSQDTGQTVGANMTAALGPSFFDASGTAVCGTPEAPILTVNNQPCVPLNLFGGFGTITPEMLGFVEFDLNDIFRSTQQGFLAAAQGDIFQLPAGPVGLAIGYEWRDQRLTNTPDSGKATNAVSGNTFSKTEGEFDVNSVFAEINLPLLANMPGAEILEIGAGVRIDDYSTIGDNTAIMLSARWKPIADLLFRASFSDIFREPTIGNLFSPQGDSYPSFQDPCSTGTITLPDNNIFATLTPEQQARCIAQGVPEGGFFQTNDQPRTRVGGNPDLGPESGETITIGLAYAPSMVPGLTFTADYWDIDLDDPIQAVGGPTIVDQCIVQGNLEFCDDIFRQGPGGNQGEVERIIALTRNTGRLTASGFDFELAYNRSTAIGLWNFRTLWTLLDERKSQVLPGGVFPDVTGTFTASGDFGLNEAVWPELKGLTTVDWTLGNFGASASWEYIDGVTELATFNTPGTEHKVPEVNYFDVTGRFTMPWGTRLTAGLTNVFNTQPPFIVRAFNARTDTDTYRMLGRSYFINVTHDF